MVNKYQDALKTLKNFFGEYSPYNKELNIIQELIDKETPMKVDKEHYDLVDSDAGEYFIVSDYYYKCPNSKCTLHKRYVINLEEDRCPKCNQRLDWR